MLIVPGVSLRRLLEPVLLAGHQRLFGHPDDRRLELLLDSRHVARPHDHVAAADVDFVVERERDRLRRERFVQLAVERDDRLHAARLPRRQRHDLVALADDARGDRAAEAAEVEIRPS